MCEINECRKKRLRARHLDTQELYLQVSLCQRCVKESHDAYKEKTYKTLWLFLKNKNMKNQIQRERNE